MTQSKFIILAISLLIVQLKTENCFCRSSIENRQKGQSEQVEAPQIYISKKKSMDYIETFVKNLFNRYNQITKLDPKYFQVELMDEHVCCWDPKDMAFKAFGNVCFSFAEREKMEKKKFDTLVYGRKLTFSLLFKNKVFRPLLLNIYISPKMEAGKTIANEQAMRNEGDLTTTSFRFKRELVDVNFTKDSSNVIRSYNKKLTQILKKNKYIITKMGENVNDASKLISLNEQTSFSYHKNTRFEEQLCAYFQIYLHKILRESSQKENESKIQSTNPLEDFLRVDQSKKCKPKSNSFLIKFVPYTLMTDKSKGKKLPKPKLNEKDRLKKGEMIDKQKTQIQKIPDRIPLLPNIDRGNGNIAKVGINPKIDEVKEIDKTQPENKQIPIVKKIDLSPANLKPNVKNEEPVNQIQKTPSKIIPLKELLKPRSVVDSKPKIIPTFTGTPISNPDIKNEDPVNQIQKFTNYLKSFWPEETDYSPTKPIVPNFPIIPQSNPYLPVERLNDIPSLKKIAFTDDFQKLQKDQVNLEQRNNKKKTNGYMNFEEDSLEDDEEEIFNLLQIKLESTINRVSKNELQNIVWDDDEEEKFCFLLFKKSDKNEHESHIMVMESLKIIKRMSIFIYENDPNEYSSEPNLFDGTITLKNTSPVMSLIMDDIKHRGNPALFLVKKYETIEQYRNYVYYNLLCIFLKELEYVWNTYSDLDSDLRDIVNLNGIRLIITVTGKIIINKGEFVKRLVIFILTRINLSYILSLNDEGSVKANRQVEIRKPGNEISINKDPEVDVEFNLTIFIELVNDNFSLHVSKLSVFGTSDDSTLCEIFYLSTHHIIETLPCMKAGNLEISFIRQLQCEFEVLKANIKTWYKKEIEKEINFVVNNNELRII